MADAPIVISGLNSSGANVLLRFLADEFVQAGRNIGSPLKFVTDVSAQVASKGEKVGVIVAPTLTSALLTDGNAKVLDDTGPTTADVTLDKHRTVNFGYTQIASALDGNNTARVMIQASVASLLNGIEEDVFSAITSGFTTNVVGTYNSDITVANIVAGVAKLDDAKAPYPRVGLVRHDAKAYGALSQLAGWEQFVYTGQTSPNVLPQGSQGRMYRDVSWFKSQAMPKATNNIDNAIFCPQAIAVAMRPMAAPAGGPVAETIFDAESGIVFQILTQWNPSTLANEFVVHALYGYSVVKESWGCLFKS
ncbi:MAG TPA: hypothetical protein VGP72_10445 [Planctomycetota bacterium]|jgi:hypothetical protein